MSSRRSQRALATSPPDSQHPASQNPPSQAAASPTIDRQSDSGQLAIVGIGASAGGLEAASKLMDAWPAHSGLALILVQHLHPSHKSMMVELLARHTVLTVCQAADGMRIEAEHLYVIPPGRYLSVGDGALHLSAAPMRHGLRLPFDVLLISLAECYGARAACVVLTGTGADGTLGAEAIRAKGGLVVAQEPDTAAYDGMPRSAIEAGAVSVVLPIADIPATLIEHRVPATSDPTPAAGLPHGEPAATLPEDPAERWLPKIIDLLRTHTAHDFTSYKPGTLLRRIERRMAMATVKPAGLQRYVELLQGDANERDLLSNDLLINVTGFFRDPRVFDRMAETVIPELVKAHAVDRPIRIWVAGCSTGEETYSLAMLFLEHISAANRQVKLQIFASDIDADAIAAARDGLYPGTIETSLTPQRLTRFFLREETGWRATPELRGTIVFTVHDLLSDPPFSRIDLVSCRNLLIYLRPDAQAQVIDVFYFALAEHGVLLLGSAETIVHAESRFDAVSKRDRIYRRIGRNQSFNTLETPQPERDLPSDSLRRPNLPIRARPPTRPAAYAELGRRLVIESYAPAAALINTANATLFSLGPIDRYLRLSPGHATLDLLAMARPGLRAKLRLAIQSARETGAMASMGGRITGDGQKIAFDIDVHPVLEAGEEMLLVCFVDKPSARSKAEHPASVRRLPRIAELEHDLDLTKAELQEALRALELASEEQKATNEEALSVNEEYQSTNEELITSKEELQSLNEELTALNSQLQETLERQRTTSDDLQNVLYSTNVATLFLDRDLRIRFFTPATKSLFAIIATDVGRPLTDLAALTLDAALEADARAVLDASEPVERETEARNGTWFRRRILPYRAHGERVEGVVITFNDITRRKQIATALEAARKQAEVANAAKSRFLAAASHDLRQPLQTLALLQALLAKNVEGEKAHGLVARMDDTLGAMTGMLDTLLDINEIEAGVARAEISSFPINGLLRRLHDEFAYHAHAKGLTMKLVPCGSEVMSDPRLLEQMIRNLLSNALKYTVKGGVLLGCRRHAGFLSVEVWDTGIGIPESQHATIFEEYHQIGNAARERSRGLGLGLSIVKRVGELLAHRISLRSRRGRGSAFAIEVPLAAQAIANGLDRHSGPAQPAAGRNGAVLVVEDDPDLRQMLQLLLETEGHQVMTAPDGPAALNRLADGAPDLLLADYNLPNGLNGIELGGKLRQAMGRDLPVIILTGDLSSETARDVALQGYAKLNKPVKRPDLLQTINRLLAPAEPLSPARTDSAPAAAQPTVFVVDDDENVRSAIIAILEQDGRLAVGYPSSEAFLKAYESPAYRPNGEACLLIDAYLPGIDGIELLEQLRASGHRLPAIMITGQSDVPMAVRAMKAGASDFIEKPVGRSDLLASIARALEQSRDVTKLAAWREAAAAQIATLTERQRQIMAMVVAGQASKNIAADLGISQRTVENHRASIMHKTGSASLPALARLALAAASEGLIPETLAQPGTTLA